MPKKFIKRKMPEKKAIAFLVAIIVLSVITISTTLAYIVVKTNSIKNIFTPPIVDVEIGTDVEGNFVQNTGDVPVYARVAVVATWVDDNGQTYSQAPDVEITLKDGWTKGNDGFYYLKSKLEPDMSSTPIESISVTDPTNPPAGYTLKVQILASVIQATPASV